tara:strand:+ start:3565 stop:4218 length:654 start_codon:yes stop_codon:yes gene_type:complete
MNSKLFTLPGTLLLSALLFSSCGPSPVHEITDRRPLSEDEREPQTHLETSVRLGTDAMLRATQTQPQQRQTGPDIVYQVPEGWKELAATGMREVDLRFGENDAGEVSVLRAGGTLADNVNRWRTQMGQEPLSEDQLSKLKMGTLFGFPAQTVTIDGDYKGFGATEALPNYRMMGLILSVPEFGRSIFVKMTGPKSEVEANEEKFLEFTNSLGLQFQR